MLDLFGVENYKTAVSTNKLRNTLETDIEMISQITNTDTVFRKISYNSIAIGQAKEHAGTEEIVVGPADTIEEEINTKTKEEIKNLKKRLMH